MLKSEYIKKLLFIITISFIAIFHRLNQSTLGFDDTFYSQRAKEMIHKSDWFFVNPTYAGKIYFDNKPPMLYWFLGLCGKTFGFKNWSMRLIPAIFGFFLVLFFYYNKIVFRYKLRVSFSICFKFYSTVSILFKICYT